MADELSEGRFGADGSYVANANDPLATHDTWLDGVSKASIRAARDSKKRMEEEQKSREAAESKGEGAMAQERDDCLIGLLSILREGETVTGALARLGAMKKKVVRPKGKRAPKVAAVSRDDGMDIDDETPVAPTRPSQSTPVDPVVKQIKLLTHLASTLLSAHGDLEIYEQSYEGIMKTLKEEGAVRRDWNPPRNSFNDASLASHEDTDGTNATSARSSTLIARPSASSKQFYYKWNTPPNGQPPGQEYGPYAQAELEGWVAGGFFGEGGSTVEVRIVGVDGWKSWKEASS